MRMDAHKLPRITSIDILRALTMLLMIFVNDLGNVKDAPAWTEHTQRLTDGMGLADTVFPAFLVIVGMSIPFAIDNRKRKGDPEPVIFRHILERSLALIVMGVVLVNGESINSEATGMSDSLYDTFACLAFIFIWNAFPQRVSRGLVIALKVVGWIMLVLLAWIYRGGEENIHRFTTSWWGILGLIGWAYLLSATVFLLGRNRLANMVIFWLVCMLLSAAFHLKLMAPDSFLSTITRPIGQGAMPALVSAGVISSMLFIRLSAKNNHRRLMLTLLAISVASIGAGFLLRRFFIISKILATPSWVMICIGITFAMFVLVYWLADVKKKTAWAAIIKPAGTNTLLCYLLPYFAYALFDALNVSLPIGLRIGVIGLLKTFVFALLIVNLAGLAMKINIRLKL